MPDDVKSMAVKMASMGLSVFFVQPDGKRPAQKAFYEKANNDPEIVAQRFSDESGNPVNYNVGILAGAPLPDGRKLHVLDVDVKDGKRGLESLEELKLMGLNTDTLTVRTPTGGLHFYYGVPADWPDLKGTIGTLGNGLDTKGWHGYVLGPGSTIGEKPYELIRNGEIRTLEPWMLEHLKTRIDRPDKSHWLCDPDKEANVARAREHVSRYPAASEGERNNQLLVLAKDMRKFAVSCDTAQRIIDEHWPTAADLEDGELEKTVRSAYEGSQYEPAGIWDADSQFEDIHGELPPEATQNPIAIAKGRFVFESIDDILSLPPTTWLVNGWIPEGSPGLFYGKWGSYKSFVAMDLALHLAHGWDKWHGLALPGVPADVLVIAAEGAFGHAKRIRAFNERHGIKQNPSTLTFMRRQVNFMNDGEFKALCEAIKDLGRQFRLVVVDTVQRVTPGADSNTQEAVSLFMDRCRRLGTVAGNAATIGIHHANKSGGILGSSVFQNESDFLFRMDKTADGAVTITCEKQKEAPDNWKVDASLEEIRFNTGEHDKALVLTTFGDKTESHPSETDPPGRKGPPRPSGISLEQAQRVLDSIQAAWDAGQPWNLDRTKDNPRNLYDNAAVVAQAPRDKVKALIDLWRTASCGVIRVDRVKAGMARIAGYRVVGTLDTVTDP